jgi:hypothetical protein
MTGMVEYKKDNPVAEAASENPDIPIILIQSQCIIYYNTEIVLTLDEEDDMHIFLSTPQSNVIYRLKDSEGKYRCYYWLKEKEKFIEVPVIRDNINIYNRGIKWLL